MLCAGIMAGNCPVMLRQKRLFFRTELQVRHSSHFFGNMGLKHIREIVHESMLISVQGLAPICAPVLGGILLTVTDWRGIFEVLLALGIVLLIAFVPFRESLRRDSLAGNNVRTAFKAYLPVLRNRTFVRYVLVQAAAMGVMFTYIAASPFIFQQHYGLSVLAYSLCFGLNALGIMGGSLSVVRFRSITGGLKTGAAGFLALSVVTVVTMLAGMSVVWVERLFSSPLFVWA